MLDVLMASPTEPISKEKRTHQLTRMYMSLLSIETATNPSKEDWLAVSDAINMLDTLVTNMKVCQDESNLLQSAVDAMQSAAMRHIEDGKPIRLDGPGMQAVRAALSSYAEMLETVPARTMYQCHILTEREAMKFNK